MYDPAWTLLPLLVALGWVCTGPERAVSARGAYSLVLLFVWAARYSVMHPWDGWLHGISKEDWRYIDYYTRVGGGAAYWAGSLVSLHLTPSLLVFFGLGPLEKVLSQGAGTATPLSIVDAVAVCTILTALVLQTVADKQLRSFRGVSSSESSADHTACCCVGLWSWSRHPNYFGEAFFWFGLALVGYAEDQSDRYGWTWGGSIAMFLFFRLSSYLTDVRNLQRKPAYRKVIADVNAFVPVPPCWRKKTE